MRRAAFDQADGALGSFRFLVSPSSPSRLVSVKGQGGSRCRCVEIALSRTLVVCGEANREGPREERRRPEEKRHRSEPSPRAYACARRAAIVYLQACADLFSLSSRSRIKDPSSVPASRRADALTSSSFPSYNSSSSSLLDLLLSLLVVLLALHVAVVIALFFLVRRAQCEPERGGEKTTSGLSSLSLGRRRQRTRRRARDF